MAVALNINPEIFHQEQEYQIEGISYALTSRWNTRNGWELGIFTEDGEEVLTSLLVMPFSNLTWLYSRGTGLFKGDLWVWDTDIFFIQFFFNCL